MLHTQHRSDPSPETVFIVDDDEAVRDSLQWLLETEGYQVKCFEDPKRFLEQLQWPQTCVLLLDIRMPKLSGLEVQKILNHRDIPIPTIFITGHGDVSLAVETMKNGDELKIKSLINQHMLLAREVAESYRLDECINKLFAKLTTRELQVLERIVSGRLNKQIADDLNISIKTVEAHRANIMDKLEVTTVADLLKLALRKASEINPN
jgi:two-component system, LuxR family, response regulator TtrR